MRRHCCYKTDLSQQRISVDVVNEEYKIVRPYFLFFAEQDGKVVLDLVDPHGLHLADALPKLQGLALYAEQHATAYRRIESVGGKGEAARA